MKKLSRYQNTTLRIMTRWSLIFPEQHLRNEAYMISFQIIITFTFFLIVANIYFHNKMLIHCATDEYNNYDSCFDSTLK